MAIVLIGLIRDAAVLNSFPPLPRSFRKKEKGRASGKVETEADDRRLSESVTIHFVRIGLIDIFRSPVRADKVVTACKLNGFLIRMSKKRDLTERFLTPPV